MTRIMDIADRTYQPSLEEISGYVGNELFDELCAYMDSQYRALCKIEYSGDKVLLGWNVKFKKGGRTLCTVYPRKGHFPLLVIVGPKEKEPMEALLPTLSGAFQNVYHGTAEGMGQRWLLFDISAHTPVYDDVLQLVRLRRQSV